jgi:hypothetical protein
VDRRPAGSPRWTVQRGLVVPDGAGRGRAGGGGGFGPAGSATLDCSTVAGPDGWEFMSTVASADRMIRQS